MFLTNQNIWPQKRPAPGAGSALALLVAQVGAQHADHALATDNLAVTANLLDGSADFHDSGLYSKYG